VDEPDALSVRPIGVVHTPFHERLQAPRQPRAAAGVEGTIELFPGRHFEDALADLAGWEYIWVLFWFHRNHGWRPKVLPPRSTRRRGLFATRTPHRPNPIGLSVLRLLGVSGLTLRVADVDLLDGTPVLDIKPYVAWTDAIPGARAGWLEDDVIAEPSAAGGSAAGRPADARGEHAVRFAALADEQLGFLHAAGVPALRDDIVRVLALGPQAHAYRRIRVAADGTRTLALKDWRVRFRAEGSAVCVLALASGYRPAQLVGDEPERAPHRAFVARFGHAKPEAAGAR
jgi:tRNA-Thr(GGU) m(6)t(6)A37 methyltransferase TsaA